MRLRQKPKVRVAVWLSFPAAEAKRETGRGQRGRLCLIQELGTDVSFSLAPTAGGFTEGTTGSGCLVIWRTARKPSRVPS